MAIRLQQRAPAASNFTISMSPSFTVLPGEAVHFFADDFSGLTAGDEFDEIDLEWDYGDPGSTYDTGGADDNNANRSYGLYGMHAFMSDGSYTVTCTARNKAGTTWQETLSVTVEPLSAVTWDHDIYVDFGEVSGTPDFTGAPAEGGGVVHISTISALTAINVTGDNVRVHFRRGETFMWEDSWLMGDANLFYATSFGSGARPIIIGGVTGNIGQAFEIKDRTNIRLICLDLECDGGYDPVTCDFTRVGQTFLFSLSQTSNFDPTVGERWISHTKCYIHGVYRAHSGSGGTNVTQSDTFLAAFDCNIADWYDYGFSTGNAKCAALGCHILQNPLATIRDGKTGVIPGAADHGPARFNGVRWMTIENCRLGSHSGWSNFAREQLVQACVRFHPVGTGTYETRGNMQRCITAGSYLIDAGAISDNEVTAIGRTRLLVQRNTLYGNKQSRGMVRMTISGAYIKNNVMQRSDLGSGGYSPGNNALRLKTTSPGLHDTETYTRPMVFTFNTCISDRTNAGSREGNDFAEYAVESGGTGSWDGPLTVENNIIQADGHTNGGTFTDYKPISRGDDFKPATGSAAINAVSSGDIPVRDRAGNLRGATTNIGAHDTSVVSETVVSAPTNSVVPTIAALAAFTGEHVPGSLGTWANVDEWYEDYRYEPLWQVDAADAENLSSENIRHIHTLIESDLLDGTGTLTLGIARSNRSGSRLLATSIGQTIP